MSFLGGGHDYIIKISNVVDNLCLLLIFWQISGSDSHPCGMRCVPLADPQREVQRIVSRVNEIMEGIRISE